MSDNAMAIITLCSHLRVEKKPLTPSEWSQVLEILQAQQLTPKDILSMEEGRLREYFPATLAEHIMALVPQSGSIAHAVNEYQNQGISVVTRAEEHYPQQLINTLGNASPPLFYTAGDVSLCKRATIGFVGSRNIEVADDSYTRDTVGRVVSQGYGIVSGGARGIDSIAVEETIAQGGFAIEFVADSLYRKIRSKELLQSVEEGRRVLLSMGIPEAKFQSWLALGRNKFIYAQSKATVAVRSDYNKGGTWAGAIEALNKHYCQVCCWNNPSYQGNQALIQQGAVAIDQGMSWATLPREHDDTMEQLSFLSP